MILHVCCDHYARFDSDLLKVSKICWLFYKNKILFLFEEIDDMVVRLNILHKTLLQYAQFTKYIS